ELGDSPTSLHVQMLLTPTFHPPCCLTIEDRAVTVELCCVILRDPDTLGTVFNDIWNGSGQPTHQIANLKVFSWSDIVELSPGQTARFHRLYAEVNPAGLEECDEVARDGIGIRLR